jgi:hypothetical protein
LAGGDQGSRPFDVARQRAILGNRRHQLGDTRDRVLERRRQLSAGQETCLAERDQLVGQGKLEQRQDAVEPSITWMLAGAANVRACAVSPITCLCRTTTPDCRPGSGVS